MQFFLRHVELGCGAIETNIVRVLGMDVKLTASAQRKQVSDQQEASVGAESNSVVDGSARTDEFMEDADENEDIQK